MSPSPHCQADQIANMPDWSILFIVKWGPNMKFSTPVGSAISHGKGPRRGEKSVCLKVRRAKSLEVCVLRTWPPWWHLNFSLVELQMFFHNSHFSGPFAQIKWGCAVAWCAFAPPKAIVPTLVGKYHCGGWGPARSLCVGWAFAKKSVSLKNKSP